MQRDSSRSGGSIDVQAILAEVEALTRLADRAKVASPEPKRAERPAPAIAMTPVATGPIPADAMGSPAMRAASEPPHPTRIADESSLMPDGEELSRILTDSLPTVRVDRDPLDQAFVSPTSRAQAPQSAQPVVDEPAVLDHEGRTARAVRIAMPAPDSTATTSAAPNGVPTRSPEAAASRTSSAGARPPIERTTRPSPSQAAATDDVGRADADGASRDELESNPATQHARGADREGHAVSGLAGRASNRPAGRSDPGLEASMPDAGSSRMGRDRAETDVRSDEAAGVHAGWSGRDGRPARSAVQGPTRGRVPNLIPRFIPHFIPHFIARLLALPLWICALPMSIVPPTARSFVSILAASMVVVAPAAWLLAARTSAQPGIGPIRRENLPAAAAPADVDASPDPAPKRSPAGP